MQKLKDPYYRPDKYGLRAFGGLSAGVYAGLGKLDIPVAVNIPDEVLKLGNSYAQLELFKIFIHFLGKLIQLRDKPLIL